MSMNGLIGGVVCVVWPDRCKNSAVVWMNEWPAHRRPQWDEAIDITHNNTSAAAAARRWQWQWKSFSPASSLALRQLQQLYRLYRFTFQSSGRGIYKQNFAINIKRKERGRRCIRRPGSDYLTQPHRIVSTHIYVYIFILSSARRRKTKERDREKKKNLPCDHNRIGGRTHTPHCCYELSCCTHNLLAYEKGLGQPA